MMIIKYLKSNIHITTKTYSHYIELQNIIPVYGNCLILNMMTISVYQKKTATLGGEKLSFNYTYEFNSVHQHIVKSKDYRGNETAFYYDIAGNLIKQTNSDGTVQQKEYAWCSNTDEAVFSVSTTLTGKLSNIIYYDAFGRKVRANEKRFDGNELAVDKRYDNFRHLLKETLPHKDGSYILWNMYSYDKHNRLSNIQYASGGEQKWPYDENNVTTISNGVTRKKTMMLRENY